MVVARARQAVVRAVAGGEAVASASAAREPAATTVAARARRATTPTRPLPHAESATESARATT